ncbi:MAG: pyridoxal-dependent decarboxylase, partial [Bacteroidota bacterium]
MKNISAFYSDEYFRQRSIETIEQFSGYLRQVCKKNNQIPVLPNHSPDALYRKYQDLLEENMDLATFTEELIKDSNHLHHPRYMGHQCAAPNPLASISAMMGGLLNNGSAVYEMGPVNVAME